MERLGLRFKQGSRVPGASPARVPFPNLGASVEKRDVRSIALATVNLSLIKGP